jgi:hypothetical protein
MRDIVDQVGQRQTYITHSHNRARFDQPYATQSPTSPGFIPGGPATQQFNGGHRPGMNPHGTYPPRSSMVQIPPFEDGLPPRKLSKGHKGIKGRRNSTLSDQSRSTNFAKHHETKRETGHRTSFTCNGQSRRPSFGSHYKSTSPTEHSGEYDRTTEPFPHLVEHTANDAKPNFPISPEDLVEEFYIGKNVDDVKSLFVGRIPDTIDELRLRAILSEVVVERVDGITRRNPNAGFTFVQ